MTKGPETRHTAPVRVRLAAKAQRAAPLPLALVFERLGLAMLLRPHDRRKCFESLLLRRDPLRVFGNGERKTGRPKISPRRGAHERHEIIRVTLDVDVSQNARHH